MDLFANLDRYPESPGWRGRETSKAAAEAIAPKAKTIRERVLEAIRRYPGTADEIAKRIGATVLATRPRCTELARQLLVEDSGQRRPNDSGKMAVVWRACGEGAR